jgi:Tol biopolymer transport system component
LSSFNLVRLSKDGRWAAMGVIDRTRGLLDAWTVEIATGAARRVAALDAAMDSPVFSPKADRIVCAKAAGRPPVLAVLTLREGVVPEKLPAGLPEGSFQLPTDWSPDGRFIAETSTPINQPGRQQNADVYLIDLARKNDLVPLSIKTRHESGAVFAPDGRSIAFLANDSGHLEAYVQPFDPESRRLTGARHQISRRGAQLVRWPKPGCELFYLGADYWIYAATLTGEGRCRTSAMNSACGPRSSTAGRRSSSRTARLRAEGGPNHSADQKPLPLSGSPSPGMRFAPELPSDESAVAFRAASNFRSRSAWISCCRPASMSFGVMWSVALFRRTFAVVVNVTFHQLD